MRNVRWYKEGFSLIEVIVAVAILAVLSLPILVYFTNSAIHTAHGRDEQSANMAAQSVIEELDSIDGFDHIENDLDPALWTVDHVATDLTDTTKMHRLVSVNGDDYYADVTLDYGAYSGASVDPLSGPTAKYNAYSNPHLVDVHSPETVVISEKQDVSKIGFDNIFYKLNGNLPNHETAPTIDSATIYNNTSRTLKLTVSKYSEDVYTVKGTLVFNFANEAGKTASTEVIVDSRQIAKAKLKNIYFMFLPNYGGKDVSGVEATQKLIVDFEDMIEPGVNYASSLNVCFVCQKSNSLGKSELNAISKVNLEFDSGLCHNNVFTESIYRVNNDRVDGTAISAKPLTDEKQIKRVAAIKVDIYRSDGGGSMMIGEKLASGETTKTN